MENNCELVSSRGLLKSCSIRHPNPQTAEVNLHEYLENMNQHENMSIYVNSHSLATFVDVYLSLQIYTIFIYIINLSLYHF